MRIERAMPSGGIQSNDSNGMSPASTADDWAAV